MNYAPPQSQIGRRLGLGFGTLTLAILVLGGLGLTSVQKLRGDLDELEDRDLRGAVIAAELEVDAERVAHLTAQALYVYHGDPAKSEALSRQVKAIGKRDDEKAAQLERLLAGTAGATTRRPTPPRRPSSTRPTSARSTRRAARRPRA
jgi:hypothetical protein